MAAGGHFGWACVPFVAVVVVMGVGYVAKDRGVVVGRYEGVGVRWEGNAES